MVDQTDADIDDISENQNDVVLVEFMNQIIFRKIFLRAEILENFLFRRRKDLQLILQKFVVPKDDRNNLIRVDWTPQQCRMQKKTNIHKINRVSSEVNPDAQN